MGYGFSLEKPADGLAQTACGFNNDQMNYVRLVMLEASVINGNGLVAADRQGLEVCDETLPASRFQGVGGYVTAPEAAFIASRLRRAVAQGMVADLLDFLDDNPGETAVAAWVNEFASLNEKAAERDGYYLV